MAFIDSDSNESGPIQLFQRESVRELPVKEAMGDYRKRRLAGAELVFYRRS